MMLLGILVGAALVFVTCGGLDMARSVILALSM